MPLVASAAGDGLLKGTTQGNTPATPTETVERPAPRTAQGSVAKLILGSADAGMRRSTGSLAGVGLAAGGSEDDLGVYDLELIAARFPHMPLAFVLECERKFIEADNDASGVSCNSLSISATLFIFLLPDLSLLALPAKRTHDSCRVSLPFLRSSLCSPHPPPLTSITSMIARRSVRAGYHHLFLAA